MQYSIKYLCLAVLLVAIPLAVIVNLPWSVIWHRQSGDGRMELEMRPMIEAVDSFILDNGRVPDRSETDDLVEATRSFGITVESETDFVRKKGGEKPTDYILGKWDGDRHYCYQSWYGEYFPDYNWEIWSDGKVPVR